MFKIDLKAIAKLSQEDQAEVARQLSQLDKIAVQNPLLFFYPHAKQAEFLASHQGFKWMLGGNRAGKTTVCTVDDLIQAVDAEALPEHLRPYKKWEPPFNWRVIGQNFGMIASVVIPALKRWVPKKQLLGGTWDKAYDKQHSVLRFANGSMCEFKTYEQSPETQGGVALHRVRYDEEPPRDTYQENLYRLIDYNGDTLIAMTPVQGITWMYDEIWIPHERSRLTNAFVQVADMDDNPHLSSVAKERALASSSSEEREARKTGRFVHFHGRVYPEFTTDHVIPEADVPEEFPKYVAIDPGLKNKAAVVFVYHTPEDELVQYAELYLEGKTAADMASEIKFVNAKHGDPQWYVIDPSARNKMHNTGRSTQMEYSDHGIVTFPGQHDVKAGINRVKVRLAHKKYLVMANCVETISEFRKYRWATPARRSEQDPREAPIKKDDHLMDAMRYLIMARPYVPQVVRDNRPTDPLALMFWEDQRRQEKPTMPGHFY